MPRRSPPPPITNPKIASLDPTWRRYHGVSVLFDNPGTRPGPGIVRLEAIPVDDPDQQRLYDALAAAFTDEDCVLRNRYGFCPLPRHSYHVTVCDGPNERDAAAGAAAILEGLPDSLDRLDAEMGYLARARVLAAAGTNAVLLEASEIVVWGHVLAVRLSPVDAPARVALERIARARSELVDDLRTHLRLRTQPWRPHVSVGYFPNRNAAARAHAERRAWSGSLPQNLRSTIAFDSAAVYGFTDMASFFRRGT